MMRAKHLQHGRQAEQLALQFLRKQGLTLIERNYRCRFGEIDLIMQNSDELIFVEVRFRQHNNTHAILSVDSHKQGKLCRSAEYYLSRTSIAQSEYARFDVIGIDGQGHIEWVPHAFEPMCN